MAKHKKKRRVHGTGSPKKMNALITLGSIAVGYLAADTINTQVDKIVPKTKDSTGAEVPNGKIAMAGELGIGGLLLIKKFGKGTMRTVLTVGGGVLVGAGLKRTFKELGVIKGYQSVPVIGMNRMNGYQNTPVVAGMGVPNQLSGVPNQLSGYINAGSGISGYKSQGSSVMGGMGGGLMGSSEFCR